MEINRDSVKRASSSPYGNRNPDKPVYQSDKSIRPLQSEIKQLFKDFNQNDASFLQKINKMSNLYQQSLGQLKEGHSPNKRHYSSKESISRNLDRNNLSNLSEANTSYLGSRHLTSSPNREKVQHNLERIKSKSYEDSKELRYVCKKIFEFYASLGNRLNTESLKLHKLYRFANDALIVDKRLNTQVVDPLFYKYSQNSGSINFEQFLLLLLDIAISHNQGLSKREAFAQFFQAYIKPLYGRLYSQTDLGEYEVIFREPIQKDTCIILKSIAPAFALLHYHFFPSEYQKFSKNELEVKCENYMQNFLREFAVCPKLLSFGAAHSVLREILNIDYPGIMSSLPISLDLGKNCGTEFTLVKFLVFIVRLSMVLGFQQYGENILDDSGRVLQKEALLLLLRKMEMSAGCANFREHISASNHTSFSVWPKELREELIALNPRDKGLDSGNNSFISGRGSAGNITSFDNRKGSFSNGDSHSHRERGRSAGRSINRCGTPSPLKSRREVSLYKEEVRHVFEENDELLWSIFKTFCSFTGGNETSRVKNMSLVKLFKDAGLVRDIKKDNENISFTQSNSYSFKNTGGLADVSFTNTMKKKTINPSELDTFLREQFYLNSYRASPSKSVERHSSPDQNSPRPHTPRDRGFFEVFLRAVEFVSYRAYPDVGSSTAVSLVITQDLLSALEEKKQANVKINTKNNFKILVSILEEPTIIDILGRLKKAVHYFYRAYCRKNNLMSAEEFLSFCRNFKILPDILSKQKLLEVFQTLAPLCPITSIQPKTERDADIEESKEHSNIEGLVIDENLFVETLALIASKISILGSSVNIVDKLLYIIEKTKEGTNLSINQRILQANELLKSQKDLSDVISYIRTKYWNLVQTVNSGHQDKTSNFDDIFVYH